MDKKDIELEYWRLINEAEALRDEGNRLIRKAEDLLRQADALREDNSFNEGME